MVLRSKEDQTAPVSEKQILEAIRENRDHSFKSTLICKVLCSLNEKRDSYNGIISSIIYINESGDTFMVQTLKDGLMKFVTSYPMRYGGKMFLSKALTRLIAEKPQFVIDFFEEVIETSTTWKVNFQQENEVLSLLIKAIKAIKQAEQVDEADSTRLTQDKIDQICADAIFSCDDITKIDTLSLVLESRATTKPFSEREIYLFKILFQDALSLQEPSLRQALLAITNRTLRRFKESHRFVMREKQMYPDHNLIHTNYMQFLTWLIEFCFDSIYCNAYYGSYILTINTLKMIIQHVTFSDDLLPIGPLFSRKMCYDSLLACLNDSFEDNKRLALELLLTLPYNCEFINQKNLDSFEAMAYELVGSVNPAHSLTCQYLFKLMIGLHAKKSISDVAKNRCLLHHLNKLTNLVEEGLSETNKDFVEALRHKPIYPKLSCIRALLNDVEISAINEEDATDWQILAKKIVVISISACNSVSEIVCNLNPETIGHLPMDLKPVDVSSLSESLKVSLKISDSKLNLISSQMLLISGWKTIKECSLSLGAMCTLFWWPKEKIKARLETHRGLDIASILDTSDIHKILGFFDHYLKNLRHRGAFEQAYNGYIMVTKRIWHDDHFKTVLTDILTEIVSDFKNEARNDRKADLLKAYVTRRSAGLPFYVQAILQSEKQGESKTLRWIMNDLFEILESGNAEEYQKIHCLNILRALIKESALGEKVLIYVGKAFAITMDAFKSDSYSIRNCASMLLKSSVDRAFGMNRLRGVIHRRNQLSFEKFFTECPSLHSKMLEHIKEAADSNSSRCIATIHAIFIILFRTRPSLNPSPEFTSEKIIWPFQEHLARLVDICPDFKIRELAAKLMIRIESFMQRPIKSFDETYLSGNKKGIYSDTSDWNEVQGQLLLTKSWIDQCDCETEIPERLIHAHKFIEKLCISDSPTGIPAIIKILTLDLISSCCLKRPGSNQWLVQLIPYILEWTKLDNNLKNHQQESLIFKTITVILMSSLPNDLDQMTMPIEELVKTQGLESVFGLLVEHIALRKPDRILSINLQSSLLRFVRQVLNESRDFVDNLVDQLDIDCTVAHLTPYDILEQMNEQDTERDKLAQYCKQDCLRLFIQLRFKNRPSRIGQVFNFTSYREFKKKEGIKFTPKVSNNSQSVELMAFACKYCSTFNLHDSSNCILFNEAETFDCKLQYLTQFVAGMPDCDIKCMALLFAGKLLATKLEEVKDVSLTEISLTAIERFSILLDDMADGDHSLTIRETCSHIIQLTLRKIIDCGNVEFQQFCLMNYFSALIKLSQDEMRTIRESSQVVIVSLRDCVSTNSSNSFDKLVIGSRLDHLIRLISTEFSGSDPTKHSVSNCFELLMRIIFNHARNYSTDLAEGKERLFDKTKLNTFADHVAAIQSALEGLQLFFNRKDTQNKVSLSALNLPAEIKAELGVIDGSVDEESGDYGQRSSRIAVDSPNLGLSGWSKEENDQVVDLFLTNLEKSLDYFSNGYWNMLTDTRYAFHELSLFKRVAFIKFVFSCTKHELKNEHLITRIRDRLENIVTTSCCSTLLFKCFGMIDKI